MKLFSKASPTMNPVSQVPEMILKYVADNTGSNNTRGIANKFVHLLATSDKQYFNLYLQGFKQLYGEYPLYNEIKDCATDQAAMFGLDAGYIGDNLWNQCL